ncbi:chromate transporter [Limnofasciculus baicalensis]|uniref:Chromate transporter n=1 Tax=Limnofasciculus baicalensis BBK-W-15 TaxID=2699891 RepID=A0AAE3GTC7_9CYAN|nr:chromate transporter [Limnofasciculus baicalensis]MCP2729642.1 chromate transporter [Limnofasciculus baicalensis BBK-W-15]
MSQSSENENQSIDIATPTSPYSLWEMVLYALKLGSIGFGGPIALVGYMHRDLVEQKKWISESDYAEGLALAQLAPGPLAAQLAIYLGYVHYHILGATVVGLAFVLPSFFMVVALGWFYVRYGGISWMQAVFYGVGACVIAIIANSAYKLTQKMVKGTIIWVIYLVSVAITVITESEIIWVFLVAGILVWLVEAPPKGGLKKPKSLSLIVNPLWLLATTGVPTASGGILWKIFIYFTQAGAFVFGSGLAIVPFLYGGVVKDFQWLTDKQFLDAVAVAMITPGPVVITTGFIGFLVAGLSGSIIAAGATFIPCYLFTIIPAPYFKKHGKQPGIAAFVKGVTVAATGAIMGSVIVLARRSLIDIPTVAIALLSFALLWKFKKKLPEPVLVLSSAVVGLVLYPLIH